MEEFYQTFDSTDFYRETNALEYEEFKHQRTRFHKGKYNQKYPYTSSLSDDKALKLVDEYFDVRILTLESFILIDFESKPTSKFLGALADIMKDPTFSLLVNDNGTEASDPDIPDTSMQERKSRWVVSQTRMLTGSHELRNRPRTVDDTKCKECERGTVYSNMESAITHIRRAHVADSMTEESPRYYVLPLLDALHERLADSQFDLLRCSRDTMASILQKLVSIQDGVIYDNEFREQRGLPWQLLEAFKWIFIYVSGVSHLLHQISWFYKDELRHKNIKYLTSAKIRIKKHLLSKVGLTIEDLVRKAERVLVSPTTLMEEDNPEGFVKSVGQHYVAARIVCNLLRMPLRNNKQISNTCETYTRSLASQITRNPTKRQILSIGALRNELNMIKEFHEWQRETLYNFDLVINPDSYPRGFKHEERAKLFSSEYGLIIWEDKKLEKDIHQISQLLLNCDWMVEQVRELTEIMKDDQGRAIFIFTTVTIIFLPLSFVATYISMSGGTTGQDWSGIQALFWEVAGPLTLGVLTFCLFVAQRENIANAILAQWVEKAMTWRDVEMWRSPRSWKWGMNSETKEEVLEELD
ncbi:hypothetical protein F5B20DRAFT_574473 [Whalleya microplaca]|nr:hypothetical protein F5B20DRAFT_574473 [Whalleya microplaca]